MAEGISAHMALKDPGSPGLGNNAQLMQFTDRRCSLARTAKGEEFVLTQQRLGRAVHRLDVKGLGNLVHVPTSRQGQLPLGDEAIGVGALKRRKTRVKVCGYHAYFREPGISSPPGHFDACCRHVLDIFTTKKRVHASQQRAAARLVEFFFVYGAIGFSHQRLECVQSAIKMGNLMTRMNSGISSSSDSQDYRTAQNRRKCLGQNALNSAKAILRSPSVEESAIVGKIQTDPQLGST